MQFRLRHHIDRDKILQVEDLADLYPNSIPPRGVLTARGLQLYRWFWIGGGLFAAGLVLSALLYAEPAKSKAPAERANSTGDGPFAREAG
ncbi:MAG TPA: hypothetical protein VF614_15510 [Chthoniobacteraceae bacterium]